MLELNWERRQVVGVVRPNAKLAMDQSGQVLEGSTTVNSDPIGIQAPRSIVYGAYPKNVHVRQAGSRGWRTNSKTRE